MLKKNLTAVLIAFFFALSAGTTGAFASETEPTEDTLKALEEIEKTNAKIYEEIEKAQIKSFELYDQKNEDIQKETSLLKILEIETKYEEEVVKLISDLDMKTQQLTSDGVEKATEAGIVVEIEWVLVEFADRTAWIDPMKVIDW